MRAKILLLQAREEADPMLMEERRSFAQKAGVDNECFVPHDLLASPPSLSEVLRHDAMMVGGSGDYYVSRANLPSFDELLDVIRRVVAADHPVFASCFGFQLIVKALGGDIVHDTPNIEVGTYHLTLTEAGKQDPLLGCLPPTFNAQVGRKDRAARLPAAAINLASSERCPFHALRIAGAPVWGTQFHPELDSAENKARYLNYLEGYGGILTEEERGAALQNFRESPETAELIPRFFELVLG